MLVKGWEMGRSSEAPGTLPQLKRQGTVTSASLVHISFQQVRSSATCSPQVIAGQCLPAKWKSAETNTDCGQKLKFRNLEENLAFVTFRPIVLVIREGNEPQDQGSNPILRNKQVGELRLYLSGVHRPVTGGSRSYDFFNPVKLT